MMQLHHAQAALEGKLEFGNRMQLLALKNMEDANACIRVIVKSLDAMQAGDLPQLTRGPENAEEAYFACFAAHSEDRLLRAFDNLTGGLDWHIVASDPMRMEDAIEWQRYIVREAKRRWEGLR